MTSSGAAWALLILVALVTTLLIGWGLLGVVLLGSEQYAAGTPVPVILLALLVLTGLLASLTAPGRKSHHGPSRARATEPGKLTCPGRKPHPPEISSGMNTYNPPIMDPDYLSRDHYQPP